jgi:hypothetical protein
MDGGSNAMIIEIFDTLEDAEYFVSMRADEANRADVYFKSELYRLPDGRWRVGVDVQAQTEFKFDNFD